MGRTAAAAGGERQPARHLDNFDCSDSNKNSIRVARRATDFGIRRRVSAHPPSALTPSPPLLPPYLLYSALRTRRNTLASSSTHSRLHPQTLGPNARFTRPPAAHPNNTPPPSLLLCPPSFPPPATHPHPAENPLPQTKQDVNHLPPVPSRALPTRSSPSSSRPPPNGATTQTRPTGAGRVSSAEEGREGGCETHWSLEDWEDDWQGVEWCVFFRLPFLGPVFFARSLSRAWGCLPSRRFPRCTRGMGWSRWDARAGRRSG